MANRETTQQNWDMLIRDLSPESQREIGVKLSTHQTRNYKDLAGKLGWVGCDVDLLTRQDSANPGMALLREWSVKDGSTARALQHHLRQMGRDDIIRILTRAVCGPLDLVVVILDQQKKTDFEGPVPTFRSERVRDALISNSFIAPMVHDLRCVSHSQNVFDHESGKYAGLQLTFQRIGNKTYSGSHSGNPVPGTKSATLPSQIHDAHSPLSETHVKTTANVSTTLPTGPRERPEGGYAHHSTSTYRDIHEHTPPRIPYAVQEIGSNQNQPTSPDISGELNQQISVRQRVESIALTSSETLRKIEYPSTQNFSRPPRGPPVEHSMEPKKCVYETDLSHTTTHLLLSSTDSSLTPPKVQYPLFIPDSEPGVGSPLHHTRAMELAYPRVQKTIPGSDNTEYPTKSDPQTHVKSVASYSHPQYQHGASRMDTASPNTHRDTEDSDYITTSIETCTLTEDVPGFHADAVNNNVISHIFLPHMDRDGAFIVRPSRDEPSARSISVVFCGEVVNYRIHRRKDFSGTYLTFEYFLYGGGPVFDSINHLIKYYEVHKILDEDETDGPTLKTPL